MDLSERIGHVLRKPVSRLTIGHMENGRLVVVWTCITPFGHEFGRFRESSPHRSAPGTLRVEPHRKLAFLFYNAASAVIYLPQALLNSNGIFTNIFDRVNDTGCQTTAEASHHIGATVGKYTHNE